VNKRAAERQFLFHAAGERARAPVFKRLELNVYAADELVIVANVRTENVGKKAEVFFYRQVLIQRKTTRHIADAAAQGFIVAHHIQAVHSSLAAIG
jgi:hypothetical protein